MHFHLPKPLHGWREFAGEVAIIVLGVGIALASEQVVQTIDARSNAKDAESRIRDELGNAMTLGVERVAVHECLRERLGQIAQGLASGRKNWTQLVLPPSPGFPSTALRELYRAPTRVWVEDAYREALTKGDLNSADPELRANLAAMYKQLDDAGQLNQNEHRLNTQLAPLQFNLNLSTTERNQMLAVIAQLDWTNSLMVLMSRQTFERWHTLGFKLSADEIADARRRWWPERLQTMRQKYGSCVDQHAIAEWEPSLASAR